MRILGTWMAAATLLILVGSCANTKLIDGEFEKIEWIEIGSASPKPIANITDPDEIGALIHRVNASPREPLERVAFEHGPDGEIRFIGDSSMTAKLFLDTGNLIFGKYLVKAGIDVAKYAKEAG